MFCDEHLPFSLCSSVLLIVAISLESVPLVIGFVLMTCLSNLQVHSYTIPLEQENKTNKHELACKQKYKCANFADLSEQEKEKEQEQEKEKYNCLLEDGTFDEAGYKLLGDKVYCPMCYSVKKNKLS